MCLDYSRAAENRRMVRLKLNILGYLYVEAALKAWPRQKPLPYWIPQGDIPLIGKEEARELYGFHEVE